MFHNPSLLEIMRRGPITLVSATCGTDGQLYQNTISGPKLASVCLPDEGVYILYRNRGLQIASACDRRKCYMTQVCRCAEEQNSSHEHTTTVTTHTGAKEKFAKRFTEKFMQDRALTWLNFYEAADEIRSLGLCFLTHPRTLSWDSVFDNSAFHFDSELDEYNNSAYSYMCAPRSTYKGVKECPQGLLGSMGDAWREFVDRGDYDFKQTIAFPEWEDEEDTKTTEDHAYDGDIDDLSEWDDADTPIHTNNHDSTAYTTPLINHKKRPRPEDDFDFINDLIDEEFPRLKKVMLEPQRARDTVNQPHHTLPNRPEKVQKTNSTTESDIITDITETNSTRSRLEAASTAEITHEHPPVPVIIPPKNMLIGRGLPDCFFDEQQGFGNYDSCYSPLVRPVSADLRVASPC